MLLYETKSAIPDHAKDLRLNLEVVLGESGAPGLNARQIGLVALASAIASRYEPLTSAIATEATRYVSEAELDGARAAAAIMTMNNVYYRFTHLVEDSEYRSMRPGLRMNVIANPRCDKIDFELCSLAVSAINGCGKCMDSHERTLRKEGVAAQAIQSAVRIAAVVHAVAVTLEQANAAQTLAAAA